MSRNWLLVPLLFLYLFDLGGVGFLGPDEPRYASIGREMARTGDLVTPRLDGQPWFEKPPLLYWMTALGRMVRLPDEWAARLPVALVSVAFLLFFFRIIAREFSPRTALMATAVLSTSAGWLAYSFVAITDLPMSATLAAAMFIAIFDTRREQGYVAGVLLGLSMLAKGFVPLVLFLPMFLIARGKRLTMIAGCVVVGAPWYLLCGWHNGAPFWQEFFWKHQVERFFTSSLQHVQPFWYYVPVLLAGLFPWTPLVGLLVRGKTYDDVRVRFLAGWTVFALLFFSAARNKLPGYVLPLLPALAVVMALALDKAGAAAKWWLTASVFTLTALPVIVGALPAALLSGLSRAPLEFSPGLPFVPVAGVVLWLAWRDRLVLATLTTALAVVFGVAYVKGKVFPILDRQVSVRMFWRNNATSAANACVEDVRRDWVYGLNYYAGHLLPECRAGGGEGPLRITTRDQKLVLSPRGESP